MNIERRVKVIQEAVPEITEETVVIEVPVDQALYITAALGRLAPRMIGVEPGLYDALVDTLAPTRGYGSGNSENRDRLNHLSRRISNYLQGRTLS